MPIKYCCVNEGTVLLADFPTDVEPQFSETMQKVIATVPPKEYRKRSIEDSEVGVNYNYICNGEGRIVACVTTKDVHMRTIFAFMEAVEPTFRGGVGSQGSEIRNARKLLQNKMDFYNDPNNDKISNLNNQLNELSGLVMDNMEKVLARGQNLDTLLEKSASLSNQARQFQNCSTQLKRNLWMKNIKLTLIIVAVVLVFILVILMIVCKPNFSRCS